MCVCVCVCADQPLHVSQAFALEILYAVLWVGYCVLRSLVGASRVPSMTVVAPVFACATHEGILPRPAYSHAVHGAAAKTPPSKETTLMR